MGSGLKGFMLGILAGKLSLWGIWASEETTTGYSIDRFLREHPSFWSPIRLPLRWSKWGIFGEMLRDHLYTSHRIIAFWPRKNVGHAIPLFLLQMRKLEVWRDRGLTSGRNSSGTLHLDCHSRALSIVLLFHFENPRNIPIIMSVSQMIGAPWLLHVFL